MTQRLRMVRISLVFLFIGMLVTGMLGPVLARARQPNSSHALVMTVDGIINPVKEGFISRAIDRAEEDGAELLVIQLDTPGGLLSATREIVELLLESPVPVAVFVSPKGARAGSAGTFITAAANFAVMASGTNIGAATPISSTGQDLEDTLASKIENDAAALIRSIAQTRGRNQDKLEETVRSAASYSAQEALADNVVDLIADNLEDLLAKLDGLTADTSVGIVELQTRGLEQRPFSKNILEHFLEFISDPNVSFILLTVGGLGIVVEMFNPGLIAPGVVGVICLLLAFLAVGNLPVNWAGVVFVILATVLTVLEIVVAGFGILGVGAVVSLIVGGLILFTQFGDASPTMPTIEVSRWLLSGTGGVVTLALAYVVGLAYQSRKQGPPEKALALAGMQGTVTGELTPRGVVLVGNETWTAISEDDSVISIGEQVEVRRVDGLVLTVFRQSDPDMENNS
ncbi:MAG: nodulation protein NfeD [SAR202 cluster bacterium]|nr:nodulation protein NfeD [Dehalococcoidia bacterium]MQF88989.1 nodulation protein NfeD [SAR202 cluster bacterium]